MFEVTPADAVIPLRLVVTIVIAAMAIVLRPVPVRRREQQ
jgi:hypothetical protein